MRPEMLEGATLFNAGEYWEAHEIWELPWNAARTNGDALEAAYVQGLILLAAAIHKRRHYDNLRGGHLNYAKALRKLEVVPSGYAGRDGFDLEAFKIEVLQALEDDALRPQLPVSMARLRRATLEDAPAVSALVNAAFEKYIPLIGRKPLPMGADHSDLILNHEAWVLEENDQIIALLELMLKDDSLYIETVAVQASRQTRGIGKQLLIFAETRARALGRNAVTLFTNERYTLLLEMYSRLGYIETHRVAVQGTDAVHMRKILEAQANA